MNIIEKRQVGDLLENILFNSGVKDIDRFLNPNNKDDTNPYNFQNIEEGAKNLLFHIATDSDIVIVVDPDMDGYASATIMYQFIDDIIEQYDSKATIRYIMQDGKEHGLNDTIIENINMCDPKLIILPDSASNDWQEQLTLSTMLYDVLIIDHHEIEDESYLDIIDNVIIINNQRSDNNGKVNKNFTGAGMVYNFIKVVYDLLDTSEDKIQPPDYYLDLVAIGQIGDVSDTSDNEIRKLVFDGLDNINNEFIKSVLKLKKLNNFIAPIDLSFSIIPMVNATTRIGEAEDKKMLFNALTRTDNSNFKTPITKKKLNKETRKYEKIEFNLPITEIAAEDIVKVKTKQDNIVKKIVNELDKQTNHLQGVLIYTMDKLESGSVTGLVAMKLSKKYNKPCLVLLDDGEYYSGSGRGIEKVMDSFKDWCEETELFEFSQGHANAFGTSINKDKMNKLLRLSNEFEAKPSNDYEVDKKYISEVDESDLSHIIHHKYILGGNINVLFGYENLKVAKKNIYTKGRTIEFSVGGIDFVMWQSPEELIEKLTTGFNEYYNFNIVGEPFEVNFSGTPQNKIVIKDMEILEDSEEDDFFF